MVQAENQQLESRLDDLHRYTRTFESNIPLYTGHPTALVVHCSQHNYQLQIDDLVRNHLGCKSFDRMAVPGGPQFFRSLPHVPKFAWAGGRWTQFLVVNHELTEVILIEHEGCAWYKSSFNSLDSDAMKSRMVDDLILIRDLLLSVFPRISVRLFYAGANAETKHIQFIEVR